MRFDKFTAKLQAAIAEAQSLAVGQGHNQLDPAHLLLALIDTKETGIKALIEKADGSSSRLRDGLQRLVDDLPKVSQFDGEVQPSRDFVKLMNLTDREAQKRG
ncbi:MAG: Clp protease N-terminal domain-containing protein, partial [Pseudomonadota bacterium]|nr:Clp protease N-terminal domain-containing protein [Pseudomonadota bacterium]